MNNIEILEKLKDEQYDKETLKTICVFYDEDFKPYVLSTEERQAIENLIQENKELKDKVEYEKELRIKYQRRYDLVKENNVPKSKIREKIEELEKEIAEKQENCLDFTLIHEHEIDTNGIIKVLQEFLKEEGE